MCFSISQGASIGYTAFRTFNIQIRRHSTQLIFKIKPCLISRSGGIHQTCFLRWFLPGFTEKKFQRRILRPFPNCFSKNAPSHVFDRIFLLIYFPPTIRMILKIYLKQNYKQPQTVNYFIWRCAYGNYLLHIGILALVFFKIFIDLFSY